MRKVRGNEISMIFQEPMTSLNPVMTIGKQIAEALILHRDLDKKAAWKRAIEMLDLVKIPEPQQRAKEYPHQLSGGMRQRAMIAMALACNPEGADRRRADHRARRHHPGADPRADPRAAARVRRGGDPDHPRSRRGRRDGAPRDRDVCRPQGRGGRRSASCSPVRCIPTRAACWPRSRGSTCCAAPTSDTGRLQEIPGIVPPLFALPEGCAFAPRCPRPTTSAASSGRPTNRSSPATGPRAGIPMAELTRSRPRGHRPQEALPGAQGPAAPHGRPGLCRRRRQLHHQRGRDAGPGGRIGLRQVDRRPRHPAPDRADRRHGEGDGPGHRPAHARRSCGPTGSRCRSSSRTRSPRSTRA